MSAVLPAPPALRRGSLSHAKEAKQLRMQPPPLKY